MNGVKWTMIVLVSVLLVSCRNQPKGPDVSGIPVKTDIIRTENRLAEIKDTNDIKKLISEHPAFYRLYFSEIWPAYDGTDRDSLLGFIKEAQQDTFFSSVLTKIEARFPDMDRTKAELEDFFRYLKHYFPDKISVPTFYTFVSGFGYQVFIFEDDGGKDGVGIGLDMFLHPDMDYKTVDPDNSNFSNYITRSWNRDHISRKVADIYVSDLLGPPPGHRMLDLMIHNGKALYITKMLMPEARDTVIMEYTASQLEWCREHELQMWSFFVAEKMFYESSLAKMGKYINPSPGSPNMPPEAPGRTANYLGWKIVDAYMQRHPGTTLQQLIDLKDSQRILDESKYKPKQK